jgi:hypothetical protein
VTQSQHESIVPLTAKPTSSYVYVTPDVAARWLSSNTINRTIRQSKVNQYAHDMDTGHWTVSNDDICFNPAGQLLNGQHRLRAIVQADVTVLLCVKRNVPTAAMANMDRGASRTYSDILRWRGEKNTTILGATLKQFVLITTGRIYQDTNVQAISGNDQDAILEAEPAVRHSVEIAARLKNSIDAPPTTLAVAHFLIAARSGTDAADLYITQLAHRTGEPAGSAIHAVDSRLREIRRNRQTYSTRELIYLLLKGWNYYAAGKSVAKLQTSPKGEFRLPVVARWAR